MENSFEVELIGDRHRLKCGSDLSGIAIDIYKGRRTLYIWAWRDGTAISGGEISIDDILSLFEKGPGPFLAD